MFQQSCDYWNIQSAAVAIRLVKNKHMYTPGNSVTLDLVLHLSLRLSPKKTMYDVYFCRFDVTVPP